MDVSQDLASLSTVRDRHVPSQEEARQALEVVWQYFSSQNTKGEEAMLSMDEARSIDIIVERLRSVAHADSML